MPYSAVYTVDGSPLYTIDGDSIVVFVPGNIDITCSPNVTVTTPINSSVLVTFAAPTVDGDVPPFTTVCSPASGSSFPVGTTAVTCTATDDEGATETCSFTVTVVATQAAGCTTTLSNEFNRG